MTRVSQKRRSGSSSKEEKEIIRKRIRRSEQRFEFWRETSNGSWCNFWNKLIIKNFWTKQFSTINCARCFVNKGVLYFRLKIRRKNDASSWTKSRVIGVHRPIRAASKNSSGPFPIKEKCAYFVVCLLNVTQIARIASHRPNIRQ